MSIGPEEKTMILVHVAVEPHNIPKFLAAFQTCFQECKKEPELERFEVFDIPTDEGEFYWIETWRGDRGWFSNVSRTYLEDITLYRLFWKFASTLTQTKSNFLEGTNESFILRALPCRNPATMD